MSQLLIENTRQKADVSVVKKDSDTENPLDGGKYTLYAGNDIKNYAGQVIVTKGTALETVTTGEDGKCKLQRGSTYFKRILYLKRHRHHTLISETSLMCIVSTSMYCLKHRQRQHSATHLRMTEPQQRFIFTR